MGTCWQKACLLRHRQCPPGPRFRQGHRPASPRPMRSTPPSSPILAKVVQTTVRPLSPRTSPNSARFTTVAANWSVCSPLKKPSPCRSGWLRQGAAQHRTHIGYLQARIAELEDRMLDGIVQASQLPSVPKTTSSNPSSASVPRSLGLSWSTCPNWARKPAKASRLRSAWLLRRRRRHQKRPAHCSWQPKQSPHAGLYQSLPSRPFAMRHHESLLRRSQSARQSHQSRPDRCGSKDPHPGQRPAANHDPIPSTRKLRLLKNT